jgi:hypothetical protein
MKTCPQCGAAYADDMAYCLQDGTPLTDTSDQPTVVIPSRDTSPTTRPAIQPVKQGVSPVFAYLTVGLLALIVVGGGIAAWKLIGKNANSENTRTDQASNKPAAPERSGSPGVRNGNSNKPASPTPEAELPPMTNEAANGLLDTWEKAQDTRNYSAYRNCYDPSFRGVKRTAKGEVSEYNFSQWMDDRRKMMSGAFMEVGVDKLQIQLDGDTAELQFDQSFKVPNYEDLGPKVIKLKMTAGGPKIIYEELKSVSLVTK